MKTLTKYMGWENQPATMVNMRKPVSAANDASCASTERRGGELSDKEIISLITRAKNGPKVTKLYKGDMSAYEHDHSAAEMALMNYLAYFTQPEFRQD